MKLANKWLQGHNHSRLLMLLWISYSTRDRPARLAHDVKLVSPSEMPKLGKAGSLQSRQALVHSLVHTERYNCGLAGRVMPRDFFTDFVKVAQDEGRHFTLLAERLKELGSFYGALPAHDGLWDSATATSKDLLARLAIEHCCP
ncbi:UNVERIFIED_CONTAM: hypothetical protein Scaly_2516800 [Sesamum calycinum]|uniref:Uncharacterized protein n=1 Tax=Sesamum calycinum TaxID=2727403 RepID=A0AAW2LSL8_9LAMI